MPQDFYIGIDGGGTKTAVVLSDSDGKVLARHRARGSAIVGKPSPEACLVLNEALDAVCAQAGKERGALACLSLCLSGVDFDYEIPMQREEFSRALGVPSEKLVVVNDGVAALWGSTSKPAAAILQVGTAYIGVYRRQPGEETLFDNLNVGGLYDIRSQAITLVARMMDGRVEPSPLKDKLMKRFGLKTEAEYLEQVYRGNVSWELRSGTPALLWQAWQEGDPAARHLAESAVEDYAMAAKAMVTRTGAPEVALSFGGGIVAQAPLMFWVLMTERMAQLSPAARVQAPLLPAEAGAAVLAAWHAGQRDGSYFEKLANHWKGN